MKGKWGIYDTDDCIAAAQYLIDQGLVDMDRVIIRGGSAGGYTTINALTFEDFFAAGAALYGIADLMVFIGDTHKFESRYLDSLVGPYPEEAQRYHDRSAINFMDQLATPMIILQGLEDEIVPPSQAEIMVEALESKGLPYAYIGFRVSNTDSGKPPTSSVHRKRSCIFTARFWVSSLPTISARM